MAETRSALAGEFGPGRRGRSDGEPGVVLSEVTGRDLVQIGAWPDTVKATAEHVRDITKLDWPADMTNAVTSGGVTLFRIGPEKVWLTAPRGAGLGEQVAAQLPSTLAAVTELGHARTVLRLAGPDVRPLLHRLVPVDVARARMPVGAFAQTGIHGIGVLLHASGTEPRGDSFDLYLPRTFALSLTETIETLAAPFGLLVE